MIFGLLKELAVSTGQYIRFRASGGSPGGNVSDAPVNQSPPSAPATPSNLRSDALAGLSLDLGCGTNKRPGFLGVDRRQFPGVDGVTDLTKKNWLFERPELGSVKLVAATLDGVTGYVLPDNSVAEVFCAHFLEHLEHNQAKPERVRFMNEMWRVLVPGGRAMIVTPHWASNRAYGDFTHADKPVSEMFYIYLNKGWRKEKAPDNDIEFNPDGYSCDFDSNIGYTMNPELMNKTKAEMDFAASWYKEAVSDLCVSLTAIK
jgi:SAM-dependent methyltransferase